MDDLIYILVIVAWAAFAIYRRSQAKKTAGKTAPPAGRRIPIPTIDDIFMDDEAQSMESIPSKPSWKREAATYYGRHPDSQEGTSLEEAFGSAETMDAEIKPGPGQSSIPTSLETTVHGESPDDSDDAESFDGRQAVIFSEILKRPYL